jgi:vacuolar protein sorting-associated protein 35
MGIEDILALEASLLNLTLTCYPKQISYVDEIFKFCDQILSQAPKSSSSQYILTNYREDYSKPNSVKQIIKLLNTPLETYKNVLTVLVLENYPKLINFLSFKDRKKVAIDTAKSAIENCNSIPTIDFVNKLFQLITPLIQGSESSSQEVDPVSKC